MKDQGKLDEAVACYRRALELKPDYAEAHNNLGNALKDQGKLDEAVACYRRALELKPDYAEAHNNLGIALNDQGKLDEAVACYRRALELKPDYAEAHSNLGVALNDQGKLDEAVACYRRALELRPDFADAHWNQSLWSLLTGDFQAAGPNTSGVGKPNSVRGATFRRHSGTGGRWKEEPSSSMPSRGWAIPFSSSATLPWSSTEAGP